MLEITDQNFQSEVKESDIPVMVDFGATWCGPCKRLKPIVEELAKEYEGKAKIATVDVDQAPQTALAFKIQSVPTLIFFKGGELFDQAVGLLPKDTLKKKIDAMLA